MMEQMITKEQIAEAAEQYAEQENSAWTNDYNRFEAGANFVMQLLQQAPCTALRENLAQLLIEEQQSALRNKRRFLTKVYHNENARALERVIKMIDERPPVA